MFFGVFQAGPSSGPNSLLGHSKFRHVSNSKHDLGKILGQQKMSIEFHPERGSVLFQHDEKTTYSPEELVAMILQVGRIIEIYYTMS